MAIYNKINLSWLGLLAVIFLSQLESRAQVCAGALGDPIVSITFGTGANRFGAPIPETNYTYIAGTPNDGQYTIVQSTAGLNSGWHQDVINHTPNDGTGYMMVVNADNNPGVFYQTTINNLCPNTTYEFSAWIINILRNSGIKPNVKFSIENNAVPIKEFSTGDILEGSSTNWIQYGTIFTTPANVGVITLRITNINPGGSGNDLALDDITFRPCGPIVKSVIASVGTDAYLCVNESATYNLTSTVSAGYTNPAYQWQFFDGLNWKDLTGENNLQTTVNVLSATPTIIKYRLAVAEQSNIGSPTCRVVSPELTIRISDKPTPVAMIIGQACLGGTLKLVATGGTTYLWKGPNGFSSTEKDPVIQNTSSNNAGIYEVTVTNEGHCSATAQLEIKLLPLVNATTNITSATICDGSAPVQLEAFGGSVYSWLPTTGLSDPTISNPTALPSSTTIYTVSVSNGQCAVEKQIEVIVLKGGAVSAGPDKKLLSGQAVTLEGLASVANAAYYWTPQDYLDDPTSINPVATPPLDITYTLHVESDCGSVTDDVFVKVYPKVEIPNTFTPNGDGVNDTWSIPSIAAFPNPRIVVVNRYGRVVFEGNKESSWNGKSDGKDVPIGTYYYTLYLDKDFKFYSGWVLITR